uniref:Uncharacterized protein n=1 Tax=Aotus nancymaae TaxID=37293 RepID=A0A2K5DVQ5_AOTNA
MVGHLALDFAFLPPPGGGGDGPGGPEMGWVNPQTWLSFQGPPGGPGIRPGVGPGSEVWGIPLCPSPYEFCGGMAYCGPQVGVGLVPQGGLETSQPEGKAGAGVEKFSGLKEQPCYLFIILLSGLRLSRVSVLLLVLLVVTPVAAFSRQVIWDAENPLSIELQTPPQHTMEGKRTSNIMVLDSLSHESGRYQTLRLCPDQAQRHF